MVANEVTPRERQDALLEELKLRDSMTVMDAWNFGHALGFYHGGDAARETITDLNALCQRNQAFKTEGFWRHINEPDHIRLKHKKWADYWTAKKR